MTLVLLVGNYFATTLTLWFAHWSSHLAWSPLWGCHVGGHHALYPTSRELLSERFRYGSGKHDSNLALVPWLVLQAAIEYAALAGRPFLVCVLESLVLVSVFAYVHIQFHVRRSPLRRFAWFLEARRRHARHHDLDKNFMVADHFWDRLFGTYCGPDHDRGSVNAV